MPEFDMKLIPKDKADLTKFRNFHSWASCQFEQFNGQIVYMNSKNPDTHIYQPYYMRAGTAHPLTYATKTLTERSVPLFTLQELQYEDNIIFYTAADVEKMEANRAKKTTVTTP